MDQAAHAPGRPDGEAAGAHAVLDPAVQALTRIVDTYAPTQSPTFQPDQWRGLQPDPYTLRHESDALADRDGLDLELTAIGIAAKAIAVTSDLHFAAKTTREVLRYGASCVAGVSWIMNATPPATEPAVHITARRLLALAVAADQHLRHRGLLGPLYAVQSA